MKKSLKRIFEYFFLKKLVVLPVKQKQSLFHCDSLHVVDGEFYTRNEYLTLIKENGKQEN